MKPMHLLTSLTIIGLMGCARTNDFTPPPGATGEDTFKSVCASCHESKGEYTFELDEKMSNQDAIAMKIAKGSMGMPSFLNIQGQALTDLTTYVLSQSKTQ